MENSKRFVSLVGIKELLKKSSYQRSICNKERKLTALTVVLEIIFLHGAKEITKIIQNTDGAKKRCLL